MDWSIASILASPFVDSPFCKSSSAAFRSVSPSAVAPSSASSSSSESENFYQASEHLLSIPYIPLTSTRISLVSLNKRILSSSKGIVSAVALRNTCARTSFVHLRLLQNRGVVMGMPSSKARLKQATRLLYPVHRLPRYSTW
jgi:hypothetical protein